MLVGIFNYIKDLFERYEYKKDVETTMCSCLYSSLLEEVNNIIKYIVDVRWTLKERRDIIKVLQGAMNKLENCGRPNYTSCLW